MIEIRYKDITENDRKEIRSIIDMGRSGCRIMQIYLPPNRILNLYK